MVAMITDPAQAALPRFGGPQESCGDFDIRIDREGVWYYHNSPIRRMPLVKLFASVLRREADGSHWLVTPVERGQIIVEDAPFLAVEMEVQGGGAEQILRLRTNLDEWVTAGAAHPLRIAEDLASGAPRPYVMVRAGLEARLVRPVFYRLVELGIEEILDGRPVFGVWSDGQFFPLGDLTAAI
jgi:hypothetical protein